MKPQLRQAQIADASAVSALVQAGFNEFVAPDWEPQAQQVFMAQSSAERFVSLIPEATFAAVAEVEGRIAGFILLTQPTLLSFLFVEAVMHKRGVARLLWEAARAHIEVAHPTVKTVELNSSPHAVAAYRALGFYPISEPFRRGGCLATRMACWLPGRALENNGHAA
jgi:GNAT superfamily N-acetyltransferase